MSREVYKIYIKYPARPYQLAVYSPPDSKVSQLFYFYFYPVYISLHPVLAYIRP